MNICKIGWRSPHKLINNAVYHSTFISSQYFIGLVVKFSMFICIELITKQNSSNLHFFASAHALENLSVKYPYLSIWFIFCCEPLDIFFWHSNLLRTAFTTFFSSFFIKPGKRIQGWHFKWKMDSENPNLCKFFGSNLSPTIYHTLYSHSYIGQMSPYHHWSVH